MFLMLLEGLGHFPRVYPSRLWPARVQVKSLMPELRKIEIFYGKGTPFLCLLFFLSLNLYNNGNLPFTKAQKEKTLQFFITATFSS